MTTRLIASRLEIGIRIQQLFDDACGLLGINAPLETRHLKTRLTNRVHT